MYRCRQLTMKTWHICSLPQGVLLQSGPFLGPSNIIIPADSNFALLKNLLQYLSSLLSSAPVEDAPRPGGSLAKDSFLSVVVSRTLHTGEVAGSIPAGNRTKVLCVTNLQVKHRKLCPLFSPLKILLSDRAGRPLIFSSPREPMFPWCSGYHICLTRRRSPVRSRTETVLKMCGAPSTNNQSGKVMAQAHP